MEFSGPIWEERGLILSKKSGRINLFFYKEQGGVVTKIEIPHKESFLCVSVNGENGKFLEAFYDFKGEMTAASMWLVRYFDEIEFSEGAAPDSQLLNTIDYLRDEDMDIIVNADVSSGNLYFFQCQDVSTDEHPLVVADAGVELPRGRLVSFEFRPDKDNEILSATFAAGVSDNILSLGFSINSRMEFIKDFSTQVDFKNLNVRSTPKDLWRALENVFLTLPS